LDLPRSTRTITTATIPTGNRALLSRRLQHDDAPEVSIHERLKATIQNYSGPAQRQHRNRLRLRHAHNLRQSPIHLLITGYTYDGLNNLHESLDPDTATPLTTYDKAGKTQPGLTDNRGSGRTTSTYTYDRSLNRLISAT